MRLLLGLAAIALSTVAWVVAPGAAAEEVEAPAAITRQAYFTRPLTEATPPVLLNGFPPSTACLVAGLISLPQVCGQEIRDLVDTLGLGDGLPLPSTPDADIIQLVVPGTTPVGMLGGQERYASLMQFQLPQLPDGQEFTSFDLILDQEGINFALESPLFRELVLAAVLQIEEPDPNLFVEVLQRFAAGETEAITQTVTGIEACPLVETWSGGDAQNAGLDGTRLPDANCLLGTTGNFDPTTGTWVFDLTFAAQAWTGGSASGEALANEGIILRPVGAPNVAYGDPDLSTNFQISFAGADAAEPLRPRIRYSTAAAFEPVGAPLAPAAPTLGGSPLPATPSAPAAIQPTPAPAVSPALGAISARWADRERGGGQGDIPWWVWLSPPVALGGALVVGEALMASPSARQHRPGAMSRLMRLRGIDDASVTTPSTRQPETA